MKFELKQQGEIAFKVIHPMTNRDVLKAILDEFETKRIKLTSEKRKALKTYVNTLRNDEQFVDPCGEEMELSFGFTGDNSKLLIWGFGLFMFLGIPLVVYLIDNVFNL